MISQAPGLIPLAPRALPGDGGAGEVLVGAVGLLNTYAPVFIGAFIATIIATPIVRRVALSAGIVDRPDRQRKLHGRVIPYLGGAAIFLGLLVGVALSYIAIGGPAGDLPPVPIAVLVGMVAIGFTGLADDIWKWDPRLKIAGQLVAAAALAAQDVGLGAATGLLQPIFGAPDAPLVGLGALGVTNVDLYYWVGVAIIATFVLGGCNAANLIDGLDGLLAGTGSIMAFGLLAISLIMATTLVIGTQEESLTAARVVLPLALMGALLGFLPWNFNPAAIFMGDCGSLLVGFTCVATILMFAEAGHASLLFAGVVVFALPVLDTALAIVRRKVAGLPISAPDANHIHHQLKRLTGSVPRAVLLLYAVTGCFAAMGVTLAAVSLLTSTRFLVIYAVILVFFATIIVTAYKVARLREEERAEATGEVRAEPAQRAEEPSQHA